MVVELEEFGAFAEFDEVGVGELPFVVVAEGLVGEGFGGEACVSYRGCTVPAEGLAGFAVRLDRVEGCACGHLAFAGACALVAG